MIDALKEGRISEGHTRPLLMLTDRPEEQTVLFKEITSRRMSVREAELIARKTAFERARVKDDVIDLQIRELEEKLTESLGTRVVIEKKNQATGGKITIAFFSDEDLKNLLGKLRADKTVDLASIKPTEGETENINSEMLDDRSKEEIQQADNTESDEELYSIKNFSI
jgi:ParB family chromosome partitioning protein